MARHTLGAIIFVGAAAGAGLGCGESEPPQPAPEAEVAVGPPESVYDRERRIEVEIDMPASDWRALQLDSRTMAELSEPVIQPHAYQGHLADVSVDGVLYPGVEIKKKGFIGSVSALRPSLRLDFDPMDAGLATGRRRLTLNNDVQDRSHARQCMAFDLFGEAGLPAPRCSFARVSVNGVDLGTYTNLEPINQAFLRRVFGDDSGDLFEGTLADFDAETWQLIELETNNSSSNKARLESLVRALEAPDEEVVEELSKIVDLDQFRDFWALETLLGHWDGYAEAANNYYLYFEPARQRFVFIPWGMDQAFMGARPFDANPYEITVYARAQLSRRLYNLPEQRAAFRARLGELVEQLWDEDELLARAATIADLAPDAAPDAVSAHEAFLASHGQELRAALLEPAPEIVDAPAQEVSSCVFQRPVSGEFDTQWNYGGSYAHMVLELDGSPVAAEFTSAAQQDPDPSRATINLAAPLSDGRTLLLILLLPAASIAPGTHPFHSFESFGLMAVLGSAGEFTTLGFVGDGTLELDAAARVDAAPVTGGFEAILYQSVCLGDAAP